MASDLTLDQVRLSTELAKRLSGGSTSDPLSNITSKEQEKLSNQKPAISISAEQLEKELSDQSRPLSGPISDAISDQLKDKATVSTQEKESTEESLPLKQEIVEEKKQELSPPISNEATDPNAQEKGTKMMDCKLVKAAYAYKSRFIYIFHPNH